MAPNDRFKYKMLGVRNWKHLRAKEVKLEEKNELGKGNGAMWNR